MPSTSLQIRLTCPSASEVGVKPQPPDPWALGLSWIDNGICIADVAQLYLDCYSEGERALEGAVAVRGKLGW
jgi:hypothetical protein